MQLIVLGPNLPNVEQEFHVHAEGCTDVRRSSTYAWVTADEVKPVELASLRALVHYVYDNGIMDEDKVTYGDDAWKYYQDEFKVFPCVKGLPDVTP